MNTSHLPSKARAIAVTIVATAILALVTIAGSPTWQDVFVATFDRANTNDPSTWADLGTVTTVPKPWARTTTGDSGIKSARLYLTSDGGDPAADIGFRGSFTNTISTGVLAASFELQSDKGGGIFQGVLGIDKGGDIVGLTFNGDGSISVTGQPETFPYSQSKAYVCWLMATYVGTNTVEMDIAVAEKSTLNTVASWSFVLDQPVTGFNQLTLLRKAGPAGSFEVDSVKASWLVVGPGH